MLSLHAARKLSMYAYLRLTKQWGVEHLCKEKVSSWTLVPALTKALALAGHLHKSNKQPSTQHGYNMPSLAPHTLNMCAHPHLTKRRGEGHPRTECCCQYV